MLNINEWEEIHSFIVCAAYPSLYQHFRFGLHGYSPVGMDEIPLDKLLCLTFMFATFQLAIRSEAARRTQAGEDTDSGWDFYISSLSRRAAPERSAVIIAG